jgi:hypothetical protein
MAFIDSAPSKTNLLLASEAFQTNRGDVAGLRANYRRDMRRIISDVMIQTLLSAIVISNRSTSKFLPKRSNIGIPSG